MQSNDRVEIETSQARNSLEEFIYEMRDQISYRFKDFIKEDLVGHCLMAIRQTPRAH